MEHTRENKMGTEPVAKLIISMSLPTMFSMLIQSCYNIVDSIFVAQIGESALTAVSLAFPIQTLLIAVGVGTGVGINSLISRKLGQKKFDEANSVADHGLLLGLASWIIFAIFGLFFTKMFFTSFTSDPEVIAMGTSYTSIVTIFSFGMLIQICAEKILQATGNMTYPMISQLIGAIANLILDPILIFGLLGFPALGVAGAAIATVIGQILGMIFCLFILFTKNHEVKINLKNFKFKGYVIKDIYAVGFPSIIMQSISSVLVMGLNSILIGFSSAAVSVLGIYYKLQSFIFMPVFGLNQGTMPVLGYNYGARNKKRITSAIKVATIISVSIMAFGTLIFNIFPRQLLMAFNSSEEMLRVGIPALRIISLCFISAGVNIIISTAFQATGHGVKSLFISILRQLVIILPVAWIMARTFGVVAVWFAFPIAEIVAFFTSLIIFRYVYNKEIKPMEDKPEIPEKAAI